jgi:hypothetical protein
LYTPWQFTYNGAGVGHTAYFTGKKRPKNAHIRVVHPCYRIWRWRGNLDLHPRLNSIRKTLNVIKRNGARTLLTEVSRTELTPERG